MRADNERMYVIWRAGDSGNEDVYAVLVGPRTADSGELVMSFRQTHGGPEHEPPWAATPDEFVTWLAAQPGWRAVPDADWESWDM